MPVEAKPLFRPDVLRPYVDQFHLPAHVEALRPTLANWAEKIRSGEADRLKETELLPDFLTDFFYSLLGYSGPVSTGDSYTIRRERMVEVNGKYADAVLGRHGTDPPKYIVAVEGKGTRDPLDRPFAGRRVSAVDQAYGYAINLPCDWIIVTSMRQTRLYFKGTDQQTYEAFDTETLATDDRQLRRFVFLLGAERVVPESGECHLYSLRAASEKVGKELTKQYYLRYADIRQDLFEQLAATNPSVSRHDILAVAQKLLDRVLFIAFCEDRELLPADSLKDAFEHRDRYHTHSVWDNFVALFRSVNEGNSQLGIPVYNGGLFADDPLLSSLSVPDAVCNHFRDLGAYDYRPSSEAVTDDAGRKIIDVDILGHIFEQSITDLEKLRNELDGLTPPVGPEKHKTRRKKEGAFYTPSFITRYIIEQTLGNVMADRFEQLRIQHAGEASGTAKRSLDDPNVYELEKLNNPQREGLVKFWEAWQDELATIRLVDPACGSGAFLIEAFDQLHTAYEASNERLEELRGHRTLFDLDRKILQDNLYGVDLNEEAIEICRLSLWIKTAARGRVLTSLDHTIRVGNSVVTDPDVHERAFDWRSAFPEVFADGGFDVVVGNPPYIRQEWLAEYKPHWEDTFDSYNGTADIFVYFYELGIGLLRPRGRIGFITSGSWVRSNFGGPLRRVIAESTRIESLIDFGEYQPFEGAEMIRPTIMVASREEPSGSLRLFKWLTNGEPPRNLSDVVSASPMMTTGHLGSHTWELEPDDVLALREKLSANGSPLKEHGNIYRGVVTGLNEVFVISDVERNSLISDDPRSSEIIKPFIQGTHMRPWYIEESTSHLIFCRRGIAIEEYPAVLEYLEAHRDRLAPKPADWNNSTRWKGRKPGAYEWFEIQDTVDYWQAFEQPKIVWPDISKLPRFSIDTENRYLGNTGFVIPTRNYYLLGVLASWASWFFISKTAQPLRLRGDRWQYRLFAQFMENVPIPDADDTDRQSIASLAEQIGVWAKERYLIQENVRRRMVTAFSGSSQKLNQKATAWWEHSLRPLGSALKTSLKLSGNPFQNPRTADEWEPYLAEKKAEIESLTTKVADAETELNDRVYRLFNLTPTEIALLQREVEH